MHSQIIVILASFFVTFTVGTRTLFNLHRKRIRLSPAGLVASLLWTLEELFIIRVPEEYWYTLTWENFKCEEQTLD